MLTNFFDGLLSIFARFASLIKIHKAENDICSKYCLNFWGDEWGTECTKEEIEELHQIIKQFETKKTGNEYLQK